MPGADSHVDAVGRRRRLGPVARRLLRAPAKLYDHRLGWLLGHRFLRLTHVGRRSGRHFQTMLEVITTTASGEFVVMAGLGPGADWYRNLLTSRTAVVSIGRRRFVAAYRVLAAQESARILGEYESRHRFAAPLVRRVLSRIVGWRYDGGESARQRIAAQLPMVALSRAAITHR